MAVTIIPARGGSRAIKLKNLQLIDGKPLLKHSIDVAKKCKDISEIYVTTDCIKIATFAEKEGAIAVEEIIEGEGNSDKALINVITKKKLYNEWIIFMQCTNVFQKGKWIEEALRILKMGEFKSAVSVIKSNYYSWGPNYRYIPLNDHRLRQERDQWTENGAFWIAEGGNILQSKYRAQTPVYLYVCPWFTQFEIDEPKDLILVEFIYKTFFKNSS